MDCLALGWRHGGAAAVMEAQRGHFVIASRASNHLFEREAVSIAAVPAKAGIHVSPHTPSGFRLAPE
ncbi:MAG: hypothetical protein KA775_04755 [Ottowia sp.]|nr:hypothetical protein [Ottowia sp.]